MSQPTIVVTGANTGIGYELALGAAKRGAQVAMVCRDREKGEAAKLRIEKAAPRATVALHLADLAKQREVRRLAGELDARYPRIDVLVNNAGLVARERRLTEDDVETSFAVNHLAPFLLTHLLLPSLREGARASSHAGSNGEARIVHVSSRLHEQAGNVGTLAVRGKLTSGIGQLFIHNVENRLVINSEITGTLDLVMTGLGRADLAPWQTRQMIQER